MASAEGIYADDAIIRRIYREHVMVLAGPRALLMQAAHPVAWAGFYAQTASKDEPYERLHRTAQIVELVTYGPRREAERATRRVRSMHKQVRGELHEAAGRFPAGTPYAADDPELLLWILATLVDSGMTVYQRYVRRLSADEREALWQDWRVFGAMFGIPGDRMPASYGDFRRYMRRMLDGDDLHVTDEARATARQIVMRPPVPRAARPLPRAGELRDRRPAAAAHPRPVRLLVGPGARPLPARPHRVRAPRPRPAAAGATALQRAPAPHRRRGRRVAHCSRPRA